MLFLRPLGDAMRCLAQLRYLARVTGCKIDVLVKKEWQRQLYDGLDYIGEVLSLDNWHIPFFISPPQRGVIQNLKNAPPAWAFLQGKKAKYRKLFRLCTRAGMPTRRIVQGVPGWDGCTHPLFPNFSPDDTDLAPPALHVREQELYAMRDYLAQKHSWAGEPLVILHSGCGGMNRAGSLFGRKGGKTWAWENWAAVSQGIHASVPQALIVLTGSQAERPMTERIREKSGGQNARIVSMAGETSIRQLLALQALATSGIAINTGASHTAMAVGCPLVSIFGNHNPSEFSAGSFGWGACHTVTGAKIEGRAVAREASPIHLIRPETVLKAWRELPARQAAPGARPYVVHYLEGGCAGVRQQTFREEKLWRLLPE